MTALANPRHERFALGLAAGRSADASYEAAGYKPHRSNAARLSANDTVRARVAELQARAAAEVLVTAQSLIEIGLDIINEARAEKDFGPASATLERVAKLAGIWAGDGPSVQVNNYAEHVDAPRETREQWLERKARERSDRAA